MRIDLPVLVQRIESAAIIAFLVVGFVQLDFAWWWLLVLFLAFDLSAIGYVANSRLGAIGYDAGHSYAAPALLGVAYAAGGPRWCAFLALAWAFHIAVDRLLGYGLKHTDDSTHTHLGWVGQNRKRNAPSPG